MSQHMVIFQNPNGDPGYNQFESIEDAVDFVEKLRNDQGIDSIRIFELDEVKFDLKPYFKVELQALNAGAPSAAPSAPAPSAPAPAAPSAPAPAPAAAPSAPEPTPEPTSPASPFAPPSEQSAPSPSSPPPPAAAPSPPADEPTEDSQPARRGLFGR